MVCSVCSVSVGYGSAALRHPLSAQEKPTAQKIVPWLSLRLKEGPTVTTSVTATNCEAVKGRASIPKSQGFSGCSFW